MSGQTLCCAALSSAHLKQALGVVQALTLHALGLRCSRGSNTVSYAISLLNQLSIEEIPTPLNMNTLVRHGPDRRVDGSRIENGHDDIPTYGATDRMQHCRQQS
jgi:hypothetical protein